MKKNILMVYPEFPTTYWSMKYSLSFIHKKSSLIPLGLLTVAALLPKEYNVTLIDMNVKKLTMKDIKEADMVFISAMIVQKNSFDEVVALCNQLNIPVVAGGPYPTSSHEKISGVDHFVLNEAEITLPPFLYDYEHGKPEHMYTTTEKPDITATPAPRFDLINFRDYNNVALQNSRGCPFNCEFCDIIELFGRVPRFKDSEQFVEEMDLVYQQGFRGSLFIVDDNFIGNKNKVKELLRKIITWQRKHSYPFSLFTEASINLAGDDVLLHLMVEAGFDMVFVGIETPDAEALKSCNKSQNLNIDLFMRIQKIQKAGLEVTGGFIVGFDNDTEDIFERQIEFIQRAGIPMAMVGILGALPHTQLSKRLKKEGRLKAETAYSGNNTHSLEMSFVPVMPEKKIIEGYKRIISELYSPRKYFERCYTLLTRLPIGVQKAPRKITLIDLRALFLSLIKQTFSSYSIHYLRFLGRVVIHRAGHFPTAIEHAIKGFHFFKITEDILNAEELSSQLDNAIQTLKNTFSALAAMPGPYSHSTAKKIRTLVHYRHSLEKKYSRVSQDVQQFLNGKYNEYINDFNTYIPRMRDMHHYGITG